MLRSAFYVIIAAMLTACIPDQFIKKEYVEIPVPVSCVTWQPERKPSQFETLSSDSPVWEQVKGLMSDRENDKDYITGLESVVNGCR